MFTLIRVEWLKMRKYNAFWWVMGLTALSYPGINFIFYQAYPEMIKGSMLSDAILTMSSMNVIAGELDA